MFRYIQQIDLDPDYPQTIKTRDGTEYTKMYAVEESGEKYKGYFPLTPEGKKAAQKLVSECNDKGIDAFLIVAFFDKDKNEYAGEIVDTDKIK